MRLLPLALLLPLPFFAQETPVERQAAASVVFRVAQVKQEFAGIKALSVEYPEALEKVYTVPQVKDPE